MYKDKKVAVGETLKGIPSFVDKIYVIDDGSKDRTSEVVLTKQKNDNRIILIKHKKNKGVGGAIITGFKTAIKDGMDIVAVMAGDNQMDPDYLDDLLDPI